MHAGTGAGRATASPALDADGGGGQGRRRVLSTNQQKVLLFAQYKLAYNIVPVETVLLTTSALFTAFCIATKVQNYTLFL